MIPSIKVVIVDDVTKATFDDVETAAWRLVIVTDGSVQVFKDNYGQNAVTIEDKRQETGS